MGNEPLTGSSARCITKNEDQSCGRGTSPQNITVILPAYNEEVSIRSIVLLSKYYADHVIVVDDGSSDRTAALARKTGSEVIIHEANMGISGMLRTCFAATECAVTRVRCSKGQYNSSFFPSFELVIV